MTRVLMVGLDCLPSSVLDQPLADAMPTLSRLAREGRAGTLESTLPPITVPAWTCMLSGRDPGELGLYGFRNRRSFRYGDMVQATSRSVRFPRVWDYLTRSGRPSIIVGLPQTSPPPPIAGKLVCGFEGPLDDGPYTSPPELQALVEDLVGEYLFDVTEFRRAGLDEVLETVYEMTERRFALMGHLLQNEPWEFALLHEIGPDRMHHCFWRFHDPDHPHHEPHSPYSGAIVDYYRFLDDRLAELLEIAGPEASVLVASDHGAVAMHGGICVNEILRQAGLLTLRVDPAEAVPFDFDLVDWSRTAVWAGAGHYARIFLNLCGREHEGTVEPCRRKAMVERLKELLRTIELDDGRTLTNHVYEPAELYGAVRGLAPDLLVFFEADRWRSVGSVGGGVRQVSQNDTGADDANHSRAGVYALRLSDGRSRGRIDASILDIAPTLLGLLGETPAADLAGRDLLAA